MRCWQDSMDVFLEYFQFLASFNVVHYFGDAYGWGIYSIPKVGIMMEVFIIILMVLPF